MRRKWNVYYLKFAFVIVILEKNVKGHNVRNLDIFLQQTQKLF